MMPASRQRHSGRSGWWLLLGGLLWGIVWTACSPPSAATPTEASPQADAVTDNFSASQTRWALFDTPEIAASIQAGELYLEDRGQGIAAYSPLVGKTWNNVVIKVQVRQVEGTFNNWMGIICRQEDEENYYLFAISADGYYLILKTEDGIATPLVGPTFTSAIHTGQDTNQLEAHCEGSILSLTVNDTLLVSRSDRTFASGGVALFADAVAAGEPTTVAFDHFSLTTR